MIEFESQAESGRPNEFTDERIFEDLLPPRLGRSRDEIAKRASKLLMGGPDLTEFAEDPTDIADNPYLHPGYRLDRSPPPDHHDSVRIGSPEMDIRDAKMARNDRVNPKQELKAEAARLARQGIEIDVVHPKGFLPYLTAK